MKTINKIVTSLFALCMLGLITTACTEDVKYDPAEQLTNAQVYFSNTLLPTIDLPVDMNVTSFDIEVRRIIKTDALTANLTVDNEGSDLYSVPNSVTFAAGSDVAKITVTYDPSKIVFDDFKKITITVSDESLTSPYGNAVYAFTVGMPAPWKSLGNATFTENWLFNGVPYMVEIQQNEIDPTTFRLVDPYSQGLADPDQGFEPEQLLGDQSPYLQFQVLPAGSVYKGVTTTVPGLVVYGDINTGFYNTSNSYNTDVWVYHPSRFTSMATEDFWVHNIVLQYQDDGLPAVVQLAPYYYMPGIGGWNQTQGDGVVTIVFPGVVLADYSAEIEYTGRYTDTSGKDYAVANVTLGADVEYAKVALVSGNVTDAAINGIIDGSIESVQIDASGNVQIPCATSGKYSFIVVTYANDDAKDYNSATFNYTASASTIYAFEDFLGTYNMTGPSLFGAQYSDADMSVTIEAGDAPNTFVISGIDLADGLKASFDPASGTMSIVPQELADFYDDYYEETVTNVTFLTITKDEEESDTDPMVFTRLETGELLLTSSSAAIGYEIIGDDSAGDTWAYDGYTDLTFTPSSSLKSASVNSALHSGKVKIKEFKGIMSKAKKSKSSGETFVVKKKGSVKNLTKDLTNPTPIF